MRSHRDPTSKSRKSVLSSRDPMPKSRRSMLSGIPQNCPGLVLQLTSCFDCFSTSDLSVENDSADNVFVNINTADSDTLDIVLVIAPDST
jgi:hypothetical protein